ncbi:hypothetical protein I6F26_28350 [Ensifer sp. IC3342]|nr:hypothetical protein [Ensifer sp. BRP08]MCA1450459.1 hypothetical protein [Ensifer sp. IC3342]
MRLLLNCGRRQLAPLCRRQRSVKIEAVVAAGGPILIVPGDTQGNPEIGQRPTPTQPGRKIAARCTAEVALLASEAAYFYFPALKGIE